VRAGADEISHVQQGCLRQRKNIYVASVHGNGAARDLKRSPWPRDRAAWPRLLVPCTLVQPPEFAGLLDEMEHGSGRKQIEFAIDGLKDHHVLTLQREAGCEDGRLAFIHSATDVSGPRLNLPAAGHNFPI